MLEIMASVEAHCLTCTAAHAPLPPPPPPSPAPRSDLLSLAGLSALSALVGLRVLRVQSGPVNIDEGGVSPSDALATLARSHPALEEVRAGCVCVARGPTLEGPACSASG
jgi:hypothetical protein